MKKGLGILAILTVVLALLCSAAVADEALHGLLDRISDPENPIAYTIATLDYDVMKPEAGFDPFFTDVLSQAKLEPVDTSVEPEGEYIVLAFPDEGIRFDFLEMEAEKNYIRQVNKDGTEELFQAVLPEEVTVTVSGIMSAAAEALADIKGLAEPVWAVLPEEGWVLDSVNGTVWQDDRASLEIFLEDTSNYKVLITWGSSAWEMTEWTYGCAYDAETQTLKAEHVICDEIVTDDAGNETRKTVLDKDSEAVFALNAEGMVQITNAGDEALEGKCFERMPTETMESAELQSTREFLGLEAEDSPEWARNAAEAQGSDQVMIVAAYGDTTAWVSLHEKNADGEWKMILSTPGLIGRNGLGKTKEGDGMTPVGTFGFNRAFGIAKDPGCALDYVQVDADTYWSGDVRDGMHYNELVSLNEYPELDTENSEHIVDYTYEYQYCLNISYNAEGVPGAGSAIFLHCLGNRKPYTGGCVAIPMNQMYFVMQHVTPDCVVIIDTLDNLGGSF